MNISRILFLSFLKKLRLFMPKNLPNNILTSLQESGKLKSLKNIKQSLLLVLEE